MPISIKLSAIPTRAFQSVYAEAKARSYEASMELRNAAQEVLKGERGGRTYKKPNGGTYTASAPGEPPAVRTNSLRSRWNSIDEGTDICIQSGMFYSRYLEEGTRKMASRPYVDRIKQEAMPKILDIYGKNFNVSVM